MAGRTRKPRAKAPLPAVEPDIEEAFPEVEPDGGVLGPAMAVLKPNHRTWVLAVVQLGADHTRAARIAGFTGSANYLRVVGWRLAHTPAIQAALLEQAQAVMRTGALVAVATLVSISGNEALDARDRVAASRAILDRTGLGGTSHQEITVTRRSDKEELEQLIAFGKSMNWSRENWIANLGRATADAVQAEELARLPKPGEPITAEFSEVPA